VILRLPRELCSGALLGILFDLLIRCGVVADSC
jgi:hypothetical protein